MSVMSAPKATIKLSGMPAALFICCLLGIGPSRATQVAGPEAINRVSGYGAPASNTGLVQSAGDDFQARAWAYSCATCHGVAHSAAEGIPTLAGMPADDIVKAMLAYAGDERPGLLKRQIARGYNEAVLRRIGEWYESQLPRKKGQP